MNKLRYFFFVFYQAELALAENTEVKNFCFKHEYYINNLYFFFFLNFYQLANPALTT